MDLILLMGLDLVLLIILVNPLNCLLLIPLAWPFHDRLIMMHMMLLRHVRLWLNIMLRLPLLLLVPLLLHGGVIMPIYILVHLLIIFI